MIRRREFWASSNDLRNDVRLAECLRNVNLVGRIDDANADARTKTSSVAEFLSEILAYFLVKVRVVGVNDGT